MERVNAQNLSRYLCDCDANLIVGDDIIIIMLNLDIHDTVV